MKNLIALWLLLQTGALFAQPFSPITPMPVSVQTGKGNIMLTNKTLLVVEGSGLENNAKLLNEYIKANFGFALKISKQNTTSNAIVLKIDKKGNAINGAYRVVSNQKGIYIIGNNEPGVFYGIQSLLQIIETGPITRKNTPSFIRIPYVTIDDYPRFQYRGMHLDVGRHFFPVAFIKKYIDYLATYKYNTFHWHLTEDQGWRIEIKKYPKLTQTGSCRDRTLIGRYGGTEYDNTTYCGYYTQEQIKEIVQYASARYITVVPEIEMPGHSTAALASYPYLGCTKGPYKVMDTWGVLDDVYCAGNDSTFNFLQDVLDEVMQLFPSKYIHIGGDECPKERWKLCPACQQRIKDNNLKDEHALQSYFIQRIEKYLNSKGRNIIGWDEILEGGLAPNATVMSWRGEEGGIEAAKQNHDVIMTPGSHCYLDHSQSKNEDSLTIGGYLPIEKVYAYDPVPAVLTNEQAKHILGAQGNVWTEYMNYPSKVEYMIFPRMQALSEVLWTPVAKKNWTDFERRLPGLIKCLEKSGINYSAAYYDLKTAVLPAEKPGAVLYTLESKDKGLTIKYMDDENKAQMNLPAKDSSGKEISKQSDIYWGEGKTYQSPILVDKSNTIFAETYKGKEQISNTISQEFKFNLATGKKISLVNEPHKSYPGDGAFTLVNGVQNEKKLARSAEFLGFLGKDLDAMIDLNTAYDIESVKLHVLDQNGSWIYLPSQVEITYLPDIDLTEAVIAKAPKEIRIIDPIKEKGTNLITISSKQKCRYLHIIARNFGIIPTGNPGAGNPAWLFVDEIEVN